MILSNNILIFHNFRIQLNWSFVRLIPVQFVTLLVKAITSAAGYTLNSQELFQVLMSWFWFCWNRIISSIDFIVFSILVQLKIKYVL